MPFIDKIILSISLAQTVALYLLFKVRHYREHFKCKKIKKRYLSFYKESSQKDEEAFRQLYHYYQPKLLQFCSVQLNGDVEQAADIVDTVMFEVWNKAANYQTKASVNTWIHTIARYKVIDFLRRTARITNHL